MKNWQTLVLTVVAIGFAAYAGYLHVENGNLRAQLSETDVAEVVAEEVVEEMVEAVEEVVEESTPEGEVREERNERPSQEEQQQRREERRKEFMGRIMERFTDPDLRMDMIEESMIRIDSRYSDFFQKLDLNPEEIEAVKTLMAEQEVLRREAQMKASMASSDEEKEALREQAKLDSELLMADIQSVLGEDQAKQMQNYTAALPYKGSVDEFARSLSYTENPLSDGQSTALMNAYAKTSREFEYSLNPRELGRGGTRNLSEDQMNTYYAEKAEFDMMVLVEASGQLNESQVDSLAEKLLADREREQREATFRLEASQDFGGDDRGGRGGFDRGGRGGRGGPGGGGGRGR